MPFIYDIHERQFPATQQISEKAWILEMMFGHLDPKTKKVTIIPPSGLGTIAEMLKNPVWTTDYRSGPDFIDAIVPKQGKYSAAWIKHDWGYSARTKARLKLDNELYRDLLELGASRWQASRVWFWVRIGGMAVWARHDMKKVRALREYAKQFDFTSN